MPKETLYPGEFKQKVVESVRKNHLSYSETMKKYGTAGKMSIQSWDRSYLEEGIEGLYADRRGCGSTGRLPRQMTKQTEEDLISENQRLRAENDYLKNSMPWYPKRRIFIASERHRSNAPFGSAMAVSTQGISTDVGSQRHTSKHEPKG